MLIIRKPQLLKLVDEFAREQDWSEKTRYWARMLLRPFVKYLIENDVTAPDEITTRHILRFMADQRESKLSWSTRNGTYTCLSQWFEWMYLTGITKTNAFDSPLIKRPRKIKKQKPKAIENEYAEAMIKCAEEEAKKGDINAIRDVAILRLLLNTGVRREELVNLDINDVRLDTGEICIVGKFDKQRDVFASENTCNAIREWLKVRPQARDPALFVTLHNHKLGKVTRIVSNRVYHVVKKWRQIAKIPDDAPVFPHAFRHRFATDFAEKTNNPWALMDLMGHENLSTTQIYITFSKKALKRLAKENAPDVE